jgi:hypothetical protein
VSPVAANVDHDGVETTAMIEWISQDLSILKSLDGNRVTEDGAEAIALVYASVEGNWVVKRRMNRGERADWLLINGSRNLALEVSGTAEQNASTRLGEKKQQISQCTLGEDYPVDRLAIVVKFSTPSILAGSP